MLFFCITFAYWLILFTLKPLKYDRSFDSVSIKLKRAFPDFGSAKAHYSILRELKKISHLLNRVSQVWVDSVAMIYGV